MSRRPPPLFAKRSAWSRPRWRWAWVTVGLVLVAACSAVLVPLRGPAPTLTAPADPAPAATRSLAKPAEAGRAQAAALAPAEPANQRAGLAFVRDIAAGPEGDLIAAYAALGEGRSREAFDLTAALVRRHPDFALAQLLYADLLATRAGHPAAFGVQASRRSATQDPARLDLLEEANRRIAALRERPPAGRVPAEFVRLAPGVRHAVAVDASRSRLYVFANGPKGPKLVRDFYVSLGKDGIDKLVEGDRRTPLGVYWITTALPKRRLDARFGDGALRFNYPNAVDRLQGRTGSGLFLHGVPPEAMNRAPFATDGCVAMANSDVTQLLATLDVDATPVVISRQLSWVAPETMRQAAADFDTAWRAWSNARRADDSAAADRWYLSNATGARPWTPGRNERADVSLLGWESEEGPMMIVTSPGSAGKAGASTQYRQYWIRDPKQWRIAFEDVVVADGSSRTLYAR